MAELAKNIVKHIMFLRFLLFWLLGCWVDFLIDLLLIWVGFGSRKSTKWGAKTSQNRSLELSWGVLEGSGGHLGPKRHQDTNKRCEKWELSPPPRLPSWGQNKSKSLPRAIQKVIIFVITFWIDFEAIWYQLGSNLAPTWFQNPPKMEASWLQNRCKLGCWFDNCFWRALGTILVDLLLQHGMADVAKNIVKHIIQSRRAFRRAVLCWFICNGG